MSNKANKTTREREILQIVLDNTMAKVYACDVDTYEIVFANKALRMECPSAIEGRKCWEVLSNYGGPCPYCKLNEVMKLPLGESYIWENYNSDYNYWLQMSDSIVKWTDERKVHLITIMDITSVKANEMKLKKYKDELEATLAEKTESENQLQALSDNLPNAFTVQFQQLKDKSPVLKYVSKGVETICGITVEELLGNDMLPLLSRVRKEDIGNVAAVLKQNKAFHVEVCYTKPGDNEPVWLSIAATPRMNGSQEIVWDGIVINMTERKLLEEQLINARNKAEESDKLKSTFMANMSHEIRTPMNAIVGFVDLINQEYDNIPKDTQLEYMRIVTDNAHQLLNLIGDILDISKIDAGQMKIIPEEGNLNVLLQDIYTSFRASDLMTRDREIELKIDERGRDIDGTFVMDYVRLRQILNNLISNGIKFTSHGCVKYGYTVIPEGVRFFVEDTGIGISDKYLNDIGKPFRQFHDQSLASQYGGTGIGLAISKNLVRLMGGTFRVKSELGKGSRFEFTIPCKKSL